jgi:molybdate transport system substrate-binding protein
VRCLLRLPGIVLLLIALVTALAACGKDDDAHTGDVTVFAAASLADAFMEMGDAFEAANPDASARFNFAGSSALAAQIIEGAPAGVFVSANAAQIDKVAAEGLAGEVIELLENELVIVVPAGSDMVTGMAGLAADGLLLVLAAPDVPAGQYARESIALAGATAEYGVGFADAVLANVVSEEPDVRATLARLQLGEADAAIVYRTDALAAGDEVRIVEIPPAYTVRAEYFITVLADASNPEAAAAFVAFATGPEGAAVLERYGFLPPSP